ncbi:MAG TPA: hypothetical protein VN083_08995 [Vicinamibacteria bacterium]|jgi:hypothetical protein|nr:hypothetical protein [Vicinamibacteria bacterium]
MTRLADRTLLALGGLLLAAQLGAASLPGFTQVAQTANFVFYSQDGQAVDAARTQRFFEETSHLLGSTPEGRTNYYRYQFPEQIAVTTGLTVAGLTVPGTGEIHSSKAFHPHEIVHRVAAALGDPGAFFQEGLAVALGDRGRWNGVAVDTIAARLVSRVKNIQALVDGFGGIDSNSSYPLAGSFVGFLLKTHGARSVALFFEACGREPAQRDQNFAKVFGVTLEAASQDWAAGLKA